MTKIQKDTTVTLQVTAEGQRTQKPGFVFYSHDSETALINVKINTLGDNVELSEDDTVRIFMRVKQKGQYKHLVYKMMKSEQKSQYQLYIPDELLGYEGRVECGVYIEFSAGETLDVGYFDFQMRKSMIDGDFKELDTIYVKEFSDALEKIKQQIIDYEREHATLIGDSTREFNEFLTTSQKKVNEFLTTSQKKVDDMLNSDVKLDTTIFREYERNNNHYVSQLRSKIGEVDNLANSLNNEMGTVVEKVETLATKKEVESLNYVGTNLWAPDKYKNNVGLINSDGSVGVFSNYTYTDKILIGKAKKITRTVFVISTKVHGCKYSYYNKDGSFLSQSADLSTGNIGSITSNIPEGAYTVVIYASRKEQDPNVRLKFEFGEKATDYSINPYDIETLFDDLKTATLELSDKLLGGK